MQTMQLCLIQTLPNLAVERLEPGLEPGLLVAMNLMLATMSSCMLAHGQVREATHDRRKRSITR